MLQQSVPIRWSPSDLFYMMAVSTGTKRYNKEHRLDRNWYVYPWPLGKCTQTGYIHAVSFGRHALLKGFTDSGIYDAGDIERRERVLARAIQLYVV